MVTFCWFEQMYNDKYKMTPIHHCHSYKGSFTDLKILCMPSIHLPIPAPGHHSSFLMFLLGRGLLSHRSVSVSHPQSLVKAPSWPNILNLFISALSRDDWFL